MTLWYACPANHYDYILRAGFRREIVRLNGDPVPLGNGYTFHVSPADALGAVKNGSGNTTVKALFLCKVACGASVQGKNAIYAPVRKGNLHYDSTVDNVMTPRAVVIYTDNQAYPLYMITM